MGNREVNIALGIDHCNSEMAKIFSNIEFTKSYRKEARTSEEVAKVNERLFELIMMKQTFIRALKPYSDEEDNQSID